jgi:hypothetical protein
MKIALDYDNTITKDTAMWAHFVADAVSRGHEVVIVTSRRPDMPIFEAGDDPLVPVIYCSFTAKSRHYAADVWIDDDPRHIYTDHQLGGG